MRRLTQHARCLRWTLPLAIIGEQAVAGCGGVQRTLGVGRLERAAPRPPDHWPALAAPTAASAARVSGLGSVVGLLAVQHAVTDLAAQVDLGSSEASATHALVVDVDSGAAHVAPMALARRIVRAQSLGQDPQL